MFLFIPSSLVSKHCRVSISPAVNMIVSTLLLLLCVIVITNENFPAFHFCLIKETIGLPCPGCGITSGLMALIEARWADAWHLNPCSFIIAAGIIISMTVAMLHLTKINLVNSSFLLKITRQQNLVLLFALIFNYIITIIKTI